MCLKHLTKFEEQIFCKKFEQERKQLSLEERLFPLNRIQIKNFDLKGKALFLPSYSYRNDTYQINIDSKLINLLDSMYVYSKSFLDVTIQLVNFKNNELQTSYKTNFPDISSQIEEEARQKKLYEKDRRLSSDSFNFFDDLNINLFGANSPQDSQVKDTHSEYFNLQAEIVGGKYVLLCIQSMYQIELNVLNLDLSLVMKHNIETKNYLWQSRDFDSQHIDYIEPGYIFYLYRGLILKIDVNQKQVISQTLEQMYPITLLLRLLPVTSSEFDYYFRKCKDRNLLGYNRDDKNKIILFVVVENTIYSLNMHNLDILRQTNIFKFQQDQQPVHKGQKSDFGIQKILVVPIQIKNRQRKIFSNWTFLIQAKTYGYVLQDWKEQNLFQIQKLRLPIDKIWNQKYEKEFYLSNQNIFSDQDKIYVPSESFYNHYYEFKIEKKKGCKDYTYNCQSIQTQFQHYKKHHIFQVLPPILLDNQLTYPIYTDMNQQSLGLYQFKEEGKKQAHFILQQIDESEYKQIFENRNSQLKFQSQSFTQVYTLENGQLVSQNFTKYNKLDDNNIPFFLEELNLNNEEWLQIVQDGMFLSLYSLSLQDQVKTQSKKQQKTLFNSIISFSKLHSDSQNNFFLPLIYQNDEQQYFGIYDIASKSIIKQTIHKTKYTKHVLSYFDNIKKEYILIFIKEIPQEKYYNNIFLFFYSLSIKDYSFKFINFLFWKQVHLYEIPIEFHQIHLGVQNNVFLMYYKNILIEFDRKHRFEIKEQTKTDLYIRKQDKLFLPILINGHQYILQHEYDYKGIQQKYITIYNPEKKYLTSIDMNYIIQNNIEQKIYFNDLPILEQLSSGKIIISFGTNQFYEIIQNNG